MVAGNDVGSSEWPECFRVMGHVTCTTQHVVYVITCHKCLQLGVGECETPRERLQKYIVAARLSEPPAEHSGCAIEAHFQASSHSLADISIQYAAVIPQRLADSEVVNLMRARLENLWIRRLRAKINMRIQWRHSFPSGPTRKRRRIAP